MLRKIIKIDEARCNGCGICIHACHEGAIAMVDGKAKLMREDHCDGLGDCLPACPTNAISFEERIALPYNKEAVAAALGKEIQKPLPCGCPGSMAQVISREKGTACPAPRTSNEPAESMLAQWPVQLKLVSANAPYLSGAHLLIAADCTAYAYGDFHNRFIRGHITLIGCPKLDAGDYTEKLTQILADNDIKSVTVIRMEVPCCGGLENAVRQARSASGKALPWRVVTISTDGRIQNN